MSNCISDADIQRIARAVVDEIENRRDSRASAPAIAPRYFDTDEAARYLGFRTRAGIRHCVYRGELVPDGRGYRGGYVFTEATLDRLVKTRQRRIDGERPAPIPKALPATRRPARRVGREAKESTAAVLERIRLITVRASRRG